MFRKRRRRSGGGGKGGQPQSQEGAQTSPNTPRQPSPQPNTPRQPSPQGNAEPRIAHVPPQLTDSFKGIIERVTDRVKADLASTGKIGKMAFFVHEDGTMKAVSLVFRDEIQKEVLIKRIREKAWEENANAVLVLTEGESGRQGTAVLSGATPGLTASARVEYSVDKQAKTVTSWKMSWLDRPAHVLYLRGIFDKTGK